MRTKWIAAVAVAMMAFLAYLAWKSNTQSAAEPTASSSTMPPDAGAPAAEPASDPGVAWQAPAGWSDEGARTMRVASYSVPGKNGAAAGECAVYYFGPGQGGTPDANIERWLGEFENPQNPQHTTTTVHGLRVTHVRVRGAYRSHGGGMGAGMGGSPHAGEEAAQADQELMGAIVEGPQGLVFFKLTGPSATIESAASDFDRMIGSLRTK